VSDLVVPAEWTRLRIEDLEGTIMVIGASDTGKSTLARYLYERLCRQGRRAAYLDADVGQSTLSVPTTMSVGLAARAGDERFPPEGRRAIYFIGATTPRGHLLPTVIGAYRLREKAIALGADAIVVDTTGLVDKEQGGKALKQWKIELLAPELVIGLQRQRELEPILWPLRRDRRVRSVDLPVSPLAVERSREARIARRRERLARYFEGAQPRPVQVRQMAVYDLEWLASGAIVALQDAEGYALGLGVVELVEQAAGTFVVHTPLQGLEGVASVRCGEARWDLNHYRESRGR
jgi:polynucleotide 5'-hydroxyl-kinase GRC3/NOL9